MSTYRLCLNINLKWLSGEKKNIIPGYVVHCFPMMLSSNKRGTQTHTHTWVNVSYNPMNTEDSNNTMS